MSLAKVDDLSKVLAPEANEPGTLTAAARIQLDVQDDRRRDGRRRGCRVPAARDGPGHLRQFQERAATARGLAIPFGIAQIGKSFRNEITPRNFTFRSREFEQMEIEFFCHPTTSRKWYEYWRDRRMKWYTDLGLAGERLRLREHDKDELSHYSVGTADIEYAFPFLAGGRVRRAGRNCPSRRLRSAQPHGRQAREERRGLPGSGDGGCRGRKESRSTAAAAAISRIATTLRTSGSRRT